MAGLGRTAVVLLLAAGQSVALLATFPLKTLGTEAWHHFASLAGVLLLVAAVPGPMRTRRFLAIGVLATTVLATASGFYLLYWKEGIRVDGYQDWGVFWHVAWSWGAAVFFWQHTWVNRVALGHFFRRSLASLAPAAAHIGLYVVAIVALVVTWGPAKAWFTNENYVPLSFATWLLALVVAYASWGLLRRRDGASQKRIRGGVDLGLVPMAALAVVTGLPLLFFDPELDGLGLKYASKFWHVWPSVLFAVLVFVHGAQTWSTVRTHWRRLGAGARSPSGAGPADGGADRGQPPLSAGDAARPP
ncbi:MAG TPA: hypothetical protein VJ874_05730, partial [Candidatus Thermoplasmatota archaeon]|nr:hypothetical protein [Candidatus Thermoplasmatota archaeon]